MIKNKELEGMRKVVVEFNLYDTLTLSKPVDTLDPILIRLCVTNCNTQSISPLPQRAETFTLIASC